MELKNSLKTQNNTYQYGLVLLNIRITIQKSVRKVFFSQNTCLIDNFCTFAAEIWLSGR